MNIAPMADGGGSMIPGIKVGGSSGDGGTTAPTGNLGSSTNPFLAPYPSGQGTNPQTVPDPSSFTTPAQDNSLGGGRGVNPMPTSPFAGLSSGLDLNALIQQLLGGNSKLISGTQDTPIPTGLASSGMVPPGGPSPMTTATGTSGPNSFPANGSPDATSALAGLNPASLLGFGNAGITPSQLGGELSNSNIYPAGVGNLLGQFLQNGAGFNPQVAQALIAALGPQIGQGRANIMEQFGSQGLRDSSPAALGLADYNSQVALAEGQIFAQQYDQAVQNYMNTLTGMKMHDPKETIFGDIASLLSGLGGAGGIASLIKAIQGIGKGGGSASGGGGGGGGGQPGQKPNPQDPNGQIQNPAIWHGPGDPNHPLNQLPYPDPFAPLGDMGALDWSTIQQLLQGIGGVPGAPPSTNIGQGDYNYPGQGPSGTGQTGITDSNGNPIQGAPTDYGFGPMPGEGGSADNSWLQDLMNSIQDPGFGGGGGGGEYYSMGWGDDG